MPRSRIDFLSITCTPTCSHHSPPSSGSGSSRRSSSSSEEEETFRGTQAVAPVAAAAQGARKVKKVKFQYMWGDSGLLPLAAFRKLAEANPLRWSGKKGHESLARELERLRGGRQRPLLINVHSGAHRGLRSFSSVEHALQWLRETFQGGPVAEATHPVALEQPVEVAVPSTVAAAAAGLIDPSNREEQREPRSPEEEHLCAVCLTEAVEVMLMPCRHAVLCEGCLEETLRSSQPKCPICREGIVSHAKGSFSQDYVDVVEALEAHLERARASAYEGMYNRVTPFMVTGALLGTGAAAAFVLAPAAAPLWAGLAAGAVCTGYVPWFATTVAQFEQEGEEGSQLVRSRLFAKEDLKEPLRLAAKLGLLAVVGPAAAIVFFVPYGIYAGVLRPLSQALAGALVRCAAFNYVYLWQPLVRGGELLGEAVRDRVLLPAVEGLRHIAHGFHSYVLCPVGESLGAAWQAVLEGCASAAHRTYEHLLAPSARLLAEALCALFQSLGQAAEALYERALLPMAKGLCLVARTAEGLTVQYLLLPTRMALGLCASGIAEGAEMLLEHVIAPGARLLRRTADGVVEYIAVPMVNGLCSLGASLGTGLAEGARLIYEHALLPLAHGMVSTAGSVYRYVIIPCAEAVQGTAEVVYHYVLLPTGRAAAAGAQAVHSHVIVPAGTATAAVASVVQEAAATTAEKAYTHVLAPGSGVQTAAVAVGSSLHEAGAAVSTAVQTCATEVSAACQSVYEASRDACHDLSGRA